MHASTTDASTKSVVLPTSKVAGDEKFRALQGAQPLIAIFGRA
jgi:hypothetical protein